MIFLIFSTRKEMRNENAEAALGFASGPGDAGRIDQLSYMAVEIRESGNFSKRLELTNRNDELHRLGRAFNLMLDSLESSFQREKQFNHNVSHELRTPVTIILSESEYGLHYAENLDESKESFEIINRQTKRMKKMISHILDLSRLENQ